MTTKKFISKITTLILYLALSVVTALVLIGLFLSYLEGDMSKSIIEVLFK